MTRLQLWLKIAFVEPDISSELGREQGSEGNSKALCPSGRGSVLGEVKQVLRWISACSSEWSDEEADSSNCPSEIESEPIYANVEQLEG